MQRNITSKVKKSHVQVGSNFRKITKLQYFGVQLFSYIFYLHDFLSYEIQKHNERIYNSLSNICRICNDFRIFKNIKRNLLDRIGCDSWISFATPSLFVYVCECVLCQCSFKCYWWWDSAGLGCFWRFPCVLSSFSSSPFFTLHTALCEQYLFTAFLELQ